MTQKPQLPQALFIAGPTASGKSAFALAAAEKLNGTIINADSMQVYDTLRLLTARPSAEDEARVPHKLYGHVKAGAAYSVGQWQSNALQAISQTQAEGRVPILVGGTGLYFRSLTEGLADIPDIPDAVRQKLRQQLQTEGAAALHEALKACDSALAARLNPNDSQRILRGLEVFQATGQKLSVWQQQEPPAPLSFPVTQVLLLPERQWLYERCNARFAQMLENNALDEVKALLALKVAADSPVMKALGVAELSAYMAGETPLEAAVERAQQQTRRYAKRQMTWFRNQMIAWEAFNEQDYEDNFAKIFSFITKTGLTSA